jgi:GT2 family glycosyltransferase
MYRFPRAEDAIVALIRGNPEALYERWIAEHDTLDETDFSTIQEEILTRPLRTFFSLIVPVVSPDGALPHALSDSLQAQLYARWEVDTVAASDVDQWNAALHSASGDYLIVVDSRFVLRHHTLFLLADSIERRRDVLLIYGDEDEIDAAGRRSHHYFKPDWNPALLRSQPYFGGLVCYRRSTVLDLGGFQSADDPVWDVSSRLTAQASSRQIEHLPFIVSHRLRPSGGDGGGVEERPAPRRVSNIPPSEQDPQVSVIVPTTCGLDYLRPCLAGLMENTTYSALEILVVVNGGLLATEQREYLATVERDARVRVLLYDEGPYNFAKTNNWAAEQARGELLCFLNDDTEVINPDWLAELVGEVREDGVAGAGALLLYPSNRIQHAGVILGVGGVAAHAYRGRPRDTRGYHDRARVPQDVSCVTAACMLVRRKAFNEVGHFDPSFAVAFNDVDLCLRLRAAGWRIVWSPAAQLYHKESASIGKHNIGTRQEQWDMAYDRIRVRWRDELLADPHYSPNLSLDGLQVWQPAFPPRVSYPWKTVMRTVDEVKAFGPGDAEGQAASRAVDT